MHRNSITKNHIDCKVHSCTLNHHFVLYKKIQPIFSYFGKVFGTRTCTVMSWLRNASCLLTEFVLLLGDGGPRLFLTGPGSKMACGLWLWYTVMSMNTQAFNTNLFWGSRSHRPNRETYVKTVCALFLSLSQTHTHWLPLGRVQRGLLEWSSSYGSRPNEDSRKSSQNQVWTKQPDNNPLLKPKQLKEWTQSWVCPFGACTPDQRGWSGVCFALVKQQAGECAWAEQSCSD